MPLNQYYPIATGVGATTLTNAQWAALTNLLAQGFQNGIVEPEEFNTFLRQFSVPVSAIAQFTADNQPLDVLDDGSVANFEAKFKAAVQSVIISVVPTVSRPRASGNLTLFVNASASPVTSSGTTFGPGSDSNNGLSAATPFLTPQKAWNYLATLDMAGFGAAIQFADGTYSGAGLNCSGAIQGAGGPVAILGNVTTPANCVINHTQPVGAGSNGGAITASNGAQISINGFKVQSTYQNGIVSNNAGTNVSVQNMVYGACAGAQNLAENLGFLYKNASTTYQIVGGASAHDSFIGGGQIYNNGLIGVTLTGTPAFTSGFVTGSGPSACQLGVTFSGSATGPRYSLLDNAVLYLLSTAESAIPGSAAGTMATGGRIDGGLGADWTSYTPTISGGSGTITGTAVGYYRRVDKTVFFQVSVAVSTVSSPSAFLVSAPPFLASVTTSGAGKERGSTGKAVVWDLSAASTNFVLAFYDASSCAAINYNPVFEGFYQIAN